MLSALPKAPFIQRLRQVLEQPARSRRRLLDRAATDEMLILGFHFPFPGLGYALRQGDAFRWHPAGWNVLS